jgi:hypothetical protein
MQRVEKMADKNLPEHFTLAGPGKPFALSNFALAANMRGFLVPVPCVPLPGQRSWLAGPFPFAGARLQAGPLAVFLPSDVLGTAHGHKLWGLTLGRAEHVCDVLAHALGLRLTKYLLHQLKHSATLSTVVTLPLRLGKVHREAAWLRAERAQTVSRGV